MMVSNIFYFHPAYLGKIPLLTHIFQKGLKPPTSEGIRVFLFDVLAEYTKVQFGSTTL